MLPSRLPACLLSALLLLFGACSAPASPPAVYSPSPLPASFDVQGHRGARGLKPENTLPAFETALDLMVTTLELDLHFSADRVVVIWHDDELAPAKCQHSGPDAAPPSRRISDLTFAQLRHFRCALNPDPRQFPDQNDAPTLLAGDDYRPISLVQLFDFVETYAAAPQKSAAQRAHARSVHFNIETKRHPDDPAAIGDGWDGQTPGPFEREIVALIESRNLVARVIVQSFVHESLWAVRALNPDLRLAALSSRGRPAPAAYAQAGAAIWSPRWQDITPALLQEAHDAALRVIPWTVNEPEAMRQLIALGVDGIISDRPDLLLALQP